MLIHTLSGAARVPHDFSSMTGKPESMEATEVPGTCRCQWWCRMVPNPHRNGVPLGGSIFDGPTSTTDELAKVI